MLNRGSSYHAFSSSGPADRYFEKTLPDGRRLEIHGRRSAANGLEVFFGVYDAAGGQLAEQHHTHCQTLTLEAAMIWAAALARPSWLEDIQIASDPAPLGRPKVNLSPR
ncbi:hypothetical protein [Pseudomonas mangiferae]|uniref:Uncharacterized protein n=1 Tax=Pseudomonas mangiferae TaxID=2593654 RepID=A0A553H448_9PSED|nr:hypothetical protein [Pseudomonas mangiferae]TRX76531.1 hypothetical protein FM069_00470 [Pseudomonas mangiferae]